MTEELPIVQSYGGGKQSVATTVLVAEGRLPTPERIVIADTGREGTATWEYMHDHVNPMLKESVGLEVEVIPRSVSNWDLYAGNGDLLIPAFTEKGKMPTFCSDKWKNEVVGRYLRSKGYGPKNPIIEWIGFSVDEVGRCKDSRVAWRKKEWPLIFGLEKSLSRHDCELIVERAGLPPAPKSSCWMCPHRRNSQWRDLRDNHPEDWEKAKAFDEEVRQEDVRKGGSGVFVHLSAKPLADADIDASDQPEDALFGEIDDCNSGYCMT